ncbi:monofunctional biosynthetic peptidoglycan transglycosylase [Paracoccaceae bacterium]|nr:monofunctional biosynthetic peptidoglycan transglycosylase [Paracoccaceae bacterium]
MLRKSFFLGILKKLASKAFRIGTVLIVCLTCLTASSIVLVRFFNPPFSSYMVRESNLFQKKLDYSWTSISNMGENIALAIVATEDSNFCNHVGIDIKEIYKVVTKGEKRGASTITQQLAKNLFLWPERSLFRKMIELYFTLLIETIIPKRRILEIYLNTVETGLLSFGVDRASEKYFKRPSNKLTKEQAIRIALTLPNPKARSPKK